MSVDQRPVCEISHRGGVTLVRLHGDVDAASGLVNVVKAATAAHQPVEVDLTTAHLVDWSGVRFLAQLVVALRPARVTVSGVAPRVHDMITRSGLDRHLVVRTVDLSQPPADAEVIDLARDATGAGGFRWAQHC